MSLLGTTANQNPPFRALLSAVSINVRGPVATRANHAGFGTRWLSANVPFAFWPLRKAKALSCFRAYKRTCAENP